MGTHYVCAHAKLTADERYDLSSHLCHSCCSTLPGGNQTANDELVGTNLWEYYAGTERNGTTISPQEWLQRPGSVGQAHSGILHICDEDGGSKPKATKD